MDFWQLAALVLAVLIALFGGGWALLQRHFSLGEKLENTVQAHMLEAIARLDKVIEKLAAKVDEIEARLENQVDAIKDRLSSLNGQVQAYQSEIQKARNDMGEISRGMDAKIARFADKLEENYIGEGKYRISAKKPR